MVITERSESSRVRGVKLDGDLDTLINEIVSHSPSVESRSEFMRHGVRLALADVVSRGIVTDPHLCTQINDYLNRPSLNDLVIVKRG